MHRSSKHAIEMWKSHESRHETRSKFMQQSYVQSRVTKEKSRSCHVESGRVLETSYAFTSLLKREFFRRRFFNGFER